LTKYKIRIGAKIRVLGPLRRRFDYGKNTPVKYAICMVLIILAFLVHKTAGYLLFWLFSFIFYTAKEVFLSSSCDPCL